MFACIDCLKFILLKVHECDMGDNAITVILEEHKGFSLQHSL